VRPPRVQEIECQGVTAELKQVKGEKASIQEDLRVTVVETKRLRQEVASLKAEADNVGKRGHAHGTSEELDALKADIDLLRKENTRLEASSSVKTDTAVMMKLEGQCRELETQLLAEKDWSRSLEKEQTAGKSTGVGLESNLAAMTQRAVNAEDARDQAYKEVMTVRSESAAEIRCCQPRRQWLRVAVFALRC